MKLTSEIKNRIDTYFDNVSPEELFETAKRKYGFEEDIDFEFKNQEFSKGHINKYAFQHDNKIEVKTSSLPLAA